ncbi:MAG: DUF2207 domain-containing protein [Roseiflexaceae bacterium]|nr:DUF2207 domain-containing protein [Roseiflexaceae bacterium]
MPMFVLLFTVLALVFSPPNQAERAFVWQQIDTAVEVRADGTLGVSERLTLRYTSGPFTFAFRDLPERRLDGITNITLSDAEGAYRQVEDEESSEPRTFSVFQEDGAQRVRWVYPPTTDASRSFTLGYDVAGAVRRFADGDEVWWSIVFPDREELVEQATGVIRLPQAVAASEITASAPDAAPDGSVSIQDGEASLRASNIAPDQELTLRVRFPKGIVGGAAPAWQADSEWQENYDATTRPTVNILLSLLSVLLVAGGGVGAGLWRRGARDPKSAFSGPVYSPPDTLRPAETAQLLGETGTQAFTATMLDLANRGFVQFHEERERWKGTYVRAERVRSDEDTLDPIERRVMQALFEKEPTVVLNGTNSDIVGALPDLGRLADERLVALGLLDPARRSRRRPAIALGVILLVCGALVALFGAAFAARISFWLPVAGIALALGGVAWLTIGGSIRGLTEAGAEALARWRFFKDHLEGLAVGQGPEGHFDRLLPYAVALGGEKRLTRSYQNTNEPLPIWYYPAVIGTSSSPGTPSVAGSNLMLQDFSQNFLSSLSNASSSASSTSSSSSSGASGGGGGGAG